MQFFIFTPVLFLGLVFGVYHLHAQEPTEPIPSETAPEEPPITEDENSLIEGNPSDESEETQESDDEGGFFGDLIDFVEETITGDDEENSEEVTASEETEEEAIVVDESLESMPAPFFVNKDAIKPRLDVDIKKKDIDYTNGSYKCSVSPFAVDVTNGKVESSMSVININHVIDEAREIVIGELPIGFKVVFDNDKYTQNLTDEETEFILSVSKEKDAQKGSFIVPLLYSVGDITVMCQMNIVNQHD